MRLLPHNPDRDQRIMESGCRLMAALVLSILLFIIGFILARGLPQLKPAFIFGQPEMMGERGGIFPTLLGTFLLPLVALLIATPLGVGTAVYLTEYTRPNRLTAVIRFGTECLAGIPSIIFGLFGFVLFVVTLKLGWSILSGGLTLAVMVLPTIIRTSEEAIGTVPRHYREVALSLGATRWQAVTRVVLPSAFPGILTGIMLAFGRSIGETAAVIFTAGISLKRPLSALDSVRTMAVHFYILVREGISLPNAYGTAALLILLILAVNVATYWLMHRFLRRIHG
ncbi:MAG TPA: phosphate ABC transporter permease PstA [bacterium]|nr:phosphate ABC transporter permease PstA [bacterium]HNS48412.1 phosphate ABC transporter permease PstA [bacterium]